MEMECLPELKSEVTLGQLTVEGDAAIKQAHQLFPFPHGTWQFTHLKTDAQIAALSIKLWYIISYINIYHTISRWSVNGSV